MLVNRIGDIGIVLAMLTIYKIFGTFDFATIFSMAYKVSNENLIFFNCEFHALTLVGIFILIGAMGKSAQVGLHT